MIQQLVLLGLSVAWVGAPDPQIPKNRPYVVPLQPRNDPKPASPKPQSKSGFEAPKRRTDGNLNQGLGATPPAMSEPLDVSDWTKVSPAGAGFTVYMPDEPEERKTSVRAGEQDLTLNQYVLSTEDKSAYLVMFSELPAERRASDDAILRAAKTRVIDTLKGQLISEQSVSAGDISGNELQIQTDQGSVVRQRMFVSGNRFYQAIAAGPREFIRSSDTDKYFRSFRLAATGD